MDHLLSTKIRRILCQHKNDFGVDAEWHFFVTAHGKGVSDGLGGTIKWLAAQASLQRPYSDQIITPIQLWFQEAEPIKGTHKYHTFIPHSETELKTKIYSFSETYDVPEVIEGGLTLTMDEIFRYVSCEYDRCWWLASVVSKDSQNEEVEVTFLHPSGPAPSFVFPRNLDILKVHKNQILTKVNPNTVTGRTYTLTQKEMATVSKSLCARLNPVQ